MRNRRFASLAAFAAASFASAAARSFPLRSTLLARNETTAFCTATSLKTTLAGRRTLCPLGLNLFSLFFSRSRAASASASRVSSAPSKSHPSESSSAVAASCRASTATSSASSSSASAPNRFVSRARRAQCASRLFSTRFRSRASFSERRAAVFRARAGPVGSAALGDPADAFQAGRGDFIRARE